MPILRFRKVKDLETGDYPAINLRIRGSKEELAIRYATVQKKGSQQYLYTGKPLRSYGEGTEVVPFETPFDLM